MANEGTSEHIKTFQVGRRVIELYGVYYSDTGASGFDHYDIFEGSICLNEGDPLYDVPTAAQLLSPPVPKTMAPSFFIGS